MKWLKLYTEVVKDPKIQLLAFEDRWHFVALLCAKADGILDEAPALRDRMLSVHIGLTPVELINMRDRLVDVMLIDEDWNIYAWESRQSGSATKAARQKRYRQRLKCKEEEVRNKNKEEGERVTRNVDVTNVTVLKFPFEDFWSAYPRKQGKSEAQKKWLKLSESDRKQVMAFLTRKPYAQTEKQFIPMASTFLNQKRWEDELVSLGDSRDGDFFL